MDATIILWLLVPLAFIVGLVVVVGWLMRGGKTVRQRIALDIRALSKLPDYKDISYYYEGLAKYVETGVRPIPPPVAGTYQAEPVLDQAGQPSLSSNHSYAAPTLKHLSPGYGEAFKSLDNINLLLYLGAFLIVVSASIFVGYNFTTLSGQSKTLFLAIFAAAFYGLGILFYLRLPKLKPAGSTFTAIGLILAPLVGLAAYNFSFNQTHGGAVWFVTSIISLALYLLSYNLLRKSYIAYFMAFTSLSLIESSISLFNFPVYYLSWGMALTALLLTLIQSWRGVDPEIGKPLAISAQIFVPLSVLSSLVFVADRGLTQVGVNLLLAAAFYGLSSRLASKIAEKEAYFAATLLLIPFGVYLLLKPSDFGSSLLMGALVLIAVIYSCLIEILRHQTDNRPLLLGFVGSLTALSSGLIVIDRPAYLSLALVAALILAAHASWRLKRAETLALAIVAVLLLPQAALRQWVQPPFTASAMAVNYIWIGLVLVGLRYRLKTWSNESRSVSILGYSTAFAAALGWSAFSGHAATLVIALVLAVITLMVSYLESKAEIILITIGLVYLSLLQLQPLLNAAQPTLSLILAIGGLLMYASAALLDSGRGKFLRLGGLAGPYAGAFISVNFTTGQSLLPIASLAAAGAVSAIEALRQKHLIALEISGGVIILALEWLLYYFGVRQLQIYTHIWALYIGMLACRRHLLGALSDRDALTALALGILTIPLAGQALGANGQLYGLLLIFEGLAIVILGIALHYNMLKYWGATVLVLEVLYQLRDFFYALPKYVISAALGLGLLVAAVILLTRRKE